ncbi:hypothetical protein GCM10023148_21280 [Actinokineospora soli]
MRTTPETVDLHWVHTLAYLFAGENGGDITDPTVNNAAQVGLKRCESFLNDLRGSARLRSDTHATLLSHLSTVTRALHAAGRPGVLHQAQTCGCGTFKGRPPAQEPAPRQPDDEQQELIRDAAVAVAERDPAADAWIDDALAQPGPAQLLYYAACLLADFTTTADGPVGSPDEHLAATTLNTLLTAAPNQDTTTAAQALNGLHDADPARHRHRHRLVVARTLAARGGILLTRATAVSRAFHADGGGHLTHPATRRAAEGAMKTFDKFIYANCRVTGVLDEDTYLQILTRMIGVERDFALAARYAPRP